MSNQYNFGLVGVGPELKFGKGGSKIIHSNGKFELRNESNSLITLSGADPLDLENFVTLSYFQQNVGSRILLKDSSKVATTENLVSTYSNGVLGSGARLINAAINAPLVIDGVQLNLNDRVLVKNQTNSYENGIYVVTNPGTGSIPWILTRSTDMDEFIEVVGAFTFVETGDTNSDIGYICNSESPVAIGISPINWVKFNSVPDLVNYEADDGISIESDVSGNNVIGTKVTDTTISNKLGDLNDQLGVLSGDNYNSILKSGLVGEEAVWGDLNLNKVLYVDISSEMISENGSINRPFGTISAAIEAASDGNVILIMPGIYTEDLNIDKDLFFIGYGSLDNSSVIIVGNHDITDCGFVSENIDFRVNNSLPVLTFNNAETIRIFRGSIRNYDDSISIRISDSLLGDGWINGVFIMGNIEISHTNGTSIRFTSLYSDESKFDIDCTGTVLIEDSLKIGRINQLSGNVVLRNIGNIQPESGVSINSEADSSNFLILDNVNLQLDNFSYGSINLDNGCLWVFSDVNRDSSYDNITTPRLNYARIAEDIGYIPSNPELWDTIPENVQEALDNVASKVELNKSGDRLTRRSVITADGVNYSFAIENTLPDIVGKEIYISDIILTVTEGFSGNDVSLARVVGENDILMDFEYNDISSPGIYSINFSFIEENTGEQIYIEFYQNDGLTTASPVFGEVIVIIEYKIL